MNSAALSFSLNFVDLRAWNGFLPFHDGSRGGIEVQRFQVLQKSTANTFLEKGKHSKELVQALWTQQLEKKDFVKAGTCRHFAQ